MLTKNSLEVLKARYLLKNDKGKIIETSDKLFRRVAKAIASVDKKYKKDIKKTEKEFYNALKNLEFLPNSPTLMNAGTKLGQLSACFVLPINDSLADIFETVKNSALIHKSGGGTGFNFSSLRPKGSAVKTTHGVASGPVSFMTIFDKSTEVIKQGGKRRGANMGILNVYHPDIIEFIKSKSEQNILNNFNISVAVDNKFVNAAKKNKKIYLKFNKKIIKKINARKIFNEIVKSAWKGGDPGLIFLDEINKHNPTPLLGKIESTNPCGEIPLLPYESCNLGSINVSKIVNNKKIDWNKLKYLVYLGVHFLDNIIDANKYPLAEIEKITKANRKIGLGIMGFAEMLIMLGIPYNSEKAIQLSEKIINFISEEAKKVSIELAEERGSFLNFNKSIYKNKYKKLRNATLTGIAPTGTISIIANCSSGIEPLFAIYFVRDVLGGKKLIELNKLFVKIAKEKCFHNKKLINEIIKKGSIQNIKEIPKEIKKLFVTSQDIKPEWHLRIQAAFQKYTDNAVSKTINLPNNATINDIKKIFLLAHKLKCKGITVYRYGSKQEQVLYIGGCAGGVCEV